MSLFFRIYAHHLNRVLLTIAPLDSLSILGQLLLCALFTTLSNSPSELISLGRILVGG